VKEIFEENNFFQVPFYVQPDTSTTSVNISINGKDILDGEYVSSTPEIKIELNNISLMPVNDISSIMLLLNNNPVDLNNPNEVTYEIIPAEERVIINYKPVLTNGEYFLRVTVDSISVERYFIVNDEAKLLDVFNYPNPSPGATYFTFKLTAIPDELKIKIYTVAGRMIKEIKKKSSELEFDFNTIHWDGKDEQGNEIANGLYFYKVIISKDEKSQDVTQKLAVVR
jgi:hypothetical protein